MVNKPMFNNDADIDIDFANRNQILKLIQHIPARQESNTSTKQHNSGVYVTDIPYDPVHNCASIDYNEAESRGYYKIDFLNVSVYNSIETQEHYSELLSKEPPWDRLMDKNFCSRVIHISNHFNTITQMKPDSVARMAMFLAVIRPAKKHLVNLSWDNISTEVWKRPSNNEYFFKKSHSVSYAMLVALHMNIIDQYF